MQCQHVYRLLSAKTQIKVTIQQSMKERAFDSTSEKSPLQINYRKSHYKLGYYKIILLVCPTLQKNHLIMRLNSVRMWYKTHVLPFQSQHATSSYHIFKNKLNHT